MPLIPFDGWKLREARKQTEGLTTSQLVANRKFYYGDHFQDGQGWPVQDVLPSGVIPVEFYARLKRSFISENQIASRVETHYGAIAGKEPSWDAVPDTALPELPERGPDETEEAYQRRSALIEAQRATVLATAQELDAAVDGWWRKRRILKKLEEAARKLLYDSGHEETGREAHVVMRFYIPAGLMEVATDDEGNPLEGAVPELPPVTTLEEALDLLYLEVLEPEQAIVVTDPDTERQAGVYSYRKNNRNHVELSYLIEDGRTRLKVMDSGKSSEAQVVDRQMDGNLWHYQLTRSVFITEQVRQLQRALNMTLTVMGRNQYTAGFPARFFLDAFPPGAKFVRNTETGQYDLDTTNVQMTTGPLISNFLGGTANIEEVGGQGEIKKIHYGSPSVWESKPVEITSFREAREVLREAILGETDQLHTLISGDATASGKSRIQALGGFLRSLGETGTELNELIVWILGTAKAIALDVLGSDDLTTKYADFHFEAACRLDLGPLDPEMLNTLVTLWEKGFLSHETTLMVSRLVEDYLGELSRIKAERSESLADLERRVTIAKSLFDMRGTVAELRAAGVPGKVVDAPEGAAAVPQEQ